MKISLVIPNLNSGSVISRCLDSVVAQGYPDLEVILADGGSNDESLEICRSRAKMFTAFYSQPDNGIAEGLNHAFTAATGEVLGWLAADDELAPAALDRVARIFTEQPDAEIVTGGCRRVFCDGSEIVTSPPDDLQERIRFQNAIEQPSTFWRRDVFLRKRPPLDESLKLAFDWDLWCRMIDDGARIVTTSDVLSIYHFSESNLTSRSGSRTAAEMFEVVRRYGPARGTVAHAYRFVYRHFDLHGVFDSRRALFTPRGVGMVATMAAIRLVFGRKVQQGYNWRFASRQERGLKWHE